MLTRWYYGLVKSDKKQTTGNQVKVSGSTGAGQNALKDLSGTRLRALGGALGNQTLDGRFQDANRQQAALLEFIVARLAKVQHVQGIELQEMKSSREWFREVARGTQGFTLPDATRWHECAELYKGAADALCRGDLGRGVQLIERATEAEAKAQKETPTQVQEHLEDPLKAPVESPTAGGSTSPAAVCTATALPKGIEMADRILNIQDIMEASPPIPVGRRQNWWETESEEEESEEEDD